MIPEKKYKMKNITLEQVGSMRLDWLWEPGQIVIYQRPLCDKPYSGMIKGKPASVVETTHGRGSPREIWVYDDCIQSECIWV